MTRIRSSPVRAFRTQLGLSQAELARYLGVSRELVGHVEAARRELPPAADQRLTGLLMLLPAPLGLAPTGAPPLSPVEADPAALVRPLRARLRACRHEAARLRFQLEDFQNRATAARQCLHIVPALLADLPPGADHDRLWLTTLAADATATLRRCGAPAQTLLTLRLAVLDYEAITIEQQVAALT